MLSRLPALSGLLGDEAKLAFRNQSKGIARLWSTRHLAAVDPYWDQYLTLFDSPQDVFTLILPHDIRRALQEAPENVGTMVQVISNRLFNLVSDHTFPTQTGGTFFATSLLKLGERNTTKEVLNCLRVLQRVLPVVFEVDSSPTRFEMDILWKQEQIRDPEIADEREPQFVIADDDDDNDGNLRERGSADETLSDAEVPKPGSTTSSTLAARLFACIVDLLFCCGFTIPRELQVDHHKINYTIWEPGIGSSTNMGRNSAYDSNKTEVLRLLLVLFSRQIYVSPALLLSNPSFYTLHFVQRTQRRHVLTILCSLLNTAFGGPSSQVNIIGEMAGKLPYNHLVFKGEDSRDTLISTTLQVLCVVIDFQSGRSRDRTCDGARIQEPSPTPDTNAFRYFIAKLHRQQDFALLIKGVSVIVWAYLESVGNILPGSRKTASYLFECVVLFWRLIDINKKFRIYVVSSDKGIELVVYLLSLSANIKDSSQQQGLCRVLSYLLQTLSVEPALSAKLTSLIKVPLPSQKEYTGNLADLVISNIYIMMMGTGNLSGVVYPGFIIAITNIAPHLKGISISSSARLLRLFRAFSDPAFLLADEGNPRLLFFLLEAINSVVTRHLCESPHLVYGLLAAHRQIDTLTNFTLASGLQEIRHQQRKLELQQKPADSSSTNKGKSRDINTLTEPSGLDQKVSLRDDLHHSLDSLHDELQSEIGANTASPTTHLASTLGSIHSSEKQLGKMRQGRSQSMDGLSGLLATVGKNGFMPSEEWVSSWQRGLPLDTITVLISELLPQVRDIQRSRPKSEAQVAIINFLSTTSIGTLLPHSSFTLRSFTWSDSLLVWMTSLIWGEIYARIPGLFGVLSSTNVRLFQIKQAASHSSPLVGAVSQVVGGLIGRTADPPPAERRS